jgi:cytoskeletal protein RodZ
MNEDLKNFASDLKHLRENSSYSLQSIHQQTRIDIKFLEAIEAGNFDVIEGVYVRAFIKSYANAIGLDPEETLENYDLAREGRLYSVEKEQTEVNKEAADSPKEKVFSSDSEPVKDLQPPGAWQQKLIAPLSIFVLVIAVISIYFIFIKEDTTTIVKETPFNEIMNEKESESSENPKSNQERFEVLTPDTVQTIPVIVPEGKSEIKLLATDTTWIRVTKDDADEEEFILMPGNTKNYKPLDNVKVYIGNAGGLNIFLNDSLLNLGSKKGEIKYVQVNEDGLTFLRVQTKNADAQQN